MTDKPNSRDARPPRRTPNDNIHDTDVPEQRTVEFSSLDEHATIDPNETIAIDAPNDLDETIDPYDTVDANDPRAQITSGKPVAKPASTGESTVLPEPLDSPRSSVAKPSQNQGTKTKSLSLDKTVVLGGTDQTVQFTQSEIADALLSANDKSQKTVPDNRFDQTVEVGDLVGNDGDGTIRGKTVVDVPMASCSVMLDTNVSQTLNPREMSAEDAAFWGSLSRNPSSASQPSRLSPAINRSLSETKLHLRDQLVTDARSELANQSDYRLVRLLGKGGMGNVYVARQGSLDRLVALKVIKPLEDEKRKRFAQRGTLEQVEQERRLQFISEAVVTGDLDHPNIVPIHDIAVTGDNTLFYSMKRVSGTPWSKAIEDKSPDENIDILLRVCDAIGFAHTRGVVHRDIKPENIMLGEFGVVMVMDWGLALAKPEFDKLDSVHPSTSLGGSPAYMAPEMAIGPVERIGPASDVYLLGATLFQIITGFAPHHATNVSECLKAVASNKIRDVSKEHQSELLQIALKAMSTKIEDRYLNVAQFQASIREYRSHSESIALAARAADVLAVAEVSSDYDDYSRAIFGFEEAIKLWSSNTKAVEGLANAKLQFAEAAYRKGDFDLGLSVLERDDPTHQSLIEQLEAGKKERRSREARFAMLRKAVVAMLAFIIIGGGYAIIRIQQEANDAILATKRMEAAKDAESAARAKAELAMIDAVNATKAENVAKLEAVDAAKAENAAKLIAIAEKKNAELASLLADKAKTRAEESEKDAEKDRKIAVEKSQEAQYESYVSNIGLAKSRIEQNMFGDASTILQRLHSSADKNPPAWEWRWLWRQTAQALSSIATDASPAKSLHFSGPTGTLATVHEDGSVQLASVDSAGHLSKRGSAMQTPSGDAATLTFAPDHQSIFIGTQSGDIEVWDPSLTKKSLAWTAHKTTVNKLQFIDDLTLVSASDDHSIHLWDLTTQTELTACWNLGPVKDFAIAGKDSEWILVAAVAESTSGRATVWRLTRDTTGWKSKLTGEFLEHRRPVTSVALSPDGQTVVSGASNGTVLVWQANATQVTDYARDIEGAIKKLSSKSSQTAENKLKSTGKKPVPFQRFLDPDLVIADSSSELAHSDRVRVVRFSPDGKTILSGGDDNLIRLWDAASGKRIKELKGHGGWVLGAGFADQSGDLILSCSADKTIRSWQPATYIDASVSNRPVGSSGKTLHDEEILSARLNPLGTAVVTASRDRTAIVSRINPLTMSLEQIAALRDETDAVALKEGTTFIAQSCALDYENSLLYVASADAIVRVWNFERGTELFKIENTGLNTSLALSRDGRSLLTRSSDLNAKVLLWRLDTTGKRPPQLTHRIGGHDKDLAVTALAISADGSRLFTADNVGIGILWNGKTGEQIGSRLEMLRGYRINAAEFSPNGEEILIAADDQQLSRIRLNDRAVVSRFHHDGLVSSLSLSDDSLAAVTISEEKTKRGTRSVATLWNLETGTFQPLEHGATSIDKNGIIAGQTARITSAQFGPGGQLVAIGKEGTVDGTDKKADDTAGRIAIWSRTSEKAELIHAFKLPTTIGAPAACLPLPSGQMLTLNGDSAFHWAWNASDKMEASQTIASKINSYRANASVHSANFSADGRFVFTGSHSVKIWNLETQKSIAKVELPHDGPLMCVEPTPRGDSLQFATSGSDGTVKLFDFDPLTFKTTVLKSWTVGDKNIAMRRVCFSADGSMLLAVGDIGTIRLYRTEGNLPESVYDLPAAGSLHAAAFSSDGKYILVGGGDDNIARIWKVIESGVTNGEEPIVLGGHDDQIEDVRFLSNEAGPLRVLTASRDKSARVWDPRIGSVDHRGREILNLLSHSLSVTAVDATKNGNIVITAGSDGALIVWPASDLADIEWIQTR